MTLVVVWEDCGVGVGAGSGHGGVGEVCLIAPKRCFGPGTRGPGARANANGRGS